MPPAVVSATIPSVSSLSFSAVSPETELCELERLAEAELTIVSVVGDPRSCPQAHCSYLLEVGRGGDALTPRAPSTRASSRADCSSVPSTDCFLRIDFSLTPRKRSHDGQRTSQAAYTQPSMASMSRVLDSLMLARARHRVNAESSRETSHTRSRSATASCGRASHAPVDKDVMQYEQRLA
eukprot:CAMPEP_0115836486 /NCGR_PEP_ID=MMETSP0287-20121206/4731_1 /TAXON_ID=412157 /ORGANISM="Chrysochromulina rotalis, Strain UIO044" /LENGTH=180 /DNA_ID=CAMNT_0003289969 /DNA_START=931 /DNA_END=1475 /DNA_ORIENTATION=+